MSAITADLPAAYHRFVKIVADGDTEGFLQLFADNGTVNDWGQQYRGRDAIRAWSDEEFIGAGVTMTISQAVHVDGRITLRTTVDSQSFNGPSTIALVTDENDRLRELLITS